MYGKAETHLCRNNKTNITLLSLFLKAFQSCPYLHTVSLSSSQTRFARTSFAGCTRLIEEAGAAGFPSSIGGFGYGFNQGEGVSPFLLDRQERAERKFYVLLALLRFNALVHSHPGMTESSKVLAAQAQFPLLLSSTTITSTTCTVREIRTPSGAFKTTTVRNINTEVKTTTAGDFLKGVRMGTQGVLSDVLAFV